MDDSSSSDEKTNETDSSEDFDDSFLICSGYGNEPEYTEHEMNSLVYFKVRNFRWKKLSRFRVFWPFPRKFFSREMFQNVSSAKVFSREIFQNVSSAKVFSREIFLNRSSAKVFSREIFEKNFNIF